MKIPVFQISSPFKIWYPLCLSKYTYTCLSCSFWSFCSVVGKFRTVKYLQNGHWELFMLLSQFLRWLYSSLSQLGNRTTKTKAKPKLKSLLEFYHQYFDTCLITVALAYFYHALSLTAGILGSWYILRITPAFVLLNNKDIWNNFLLVYIVLAISVCIEWLFWQTSECQEMWKNTVLFQRFLMPGTNRISKNRHIRLLFFLFLFSSRFHWAFELPNYFM